jgi:ribosomal protein S18 acetylase RimI-like enzyme
MSDFPDKFEETVRSLPVAGLGQAGEEAVQKLAERGYEVKVGLTPEYADQILTMSHEPSILEFCPKDSSERFTDRAAAERWLAKKRAAFLLFKKEDSGALSLAGYAWTGAGSSSHAPGGEVTFAVRIGEAGQGQGLAAPFSWLTVAGSAALYGARDFWLETWASNGGAVHIYHKIGFETVAEEPDKRLVPSGDKVPDTRVYMSLPNELLPS